MIIGALLFACYVIGNNARVRSLERRLAAVEALERSPVAINIRKQEAWLDSHPGLR